MDINDFRKEKVSCAFSPTGMKEIKIPFANTLKEQIQNYVVEVFKALVFYMKHKYHEVIDLGNNITVIKINVPGDVEKFDEIAEYFTKKIKEEVKTKTFNSKKEVGKYIFPKLDEFFFTHYKRLMKNKKNLNFKK